MFNVNNFPGGSTNGAVSNEVYRFVSETGNWESVTNLLESRYFHSVDIVENVEIDANVCNVKLGIF